MSVFLLAGYWYAHMEAKKDVQKLSITSSAFEHEGAIPSKYTCDGDDISPELSWSSGPEGTKSFALICDDPDAPMGTWVHWVVFNLSSTQTKLAENAPIKNLGAVEGTNSWDKTGYGGPCPPSGSHRYYFKVYALDTTLDLDAKADKSAVLAAMKGHILAQGELMGRYERKK